MQTTLNFSGGEKEKVRKALSAYEREKSNSAYEEFRARHKGCAITLYSSGKLLIQGERHREVASEINASLKTPSSFIVGIDEAGRGEATGPFVISAVLADRSQMRAFRDSKKTTNIKASADSVSEKALAASTYSINAELIDLLREKGISMNKIEEAAIDSACSFFRELMPEAKIIVDGSPVKVKAKGVEFIPKADDKEPTVGAASIVARNARDGSKDKKLRKSWKSKQSF